MIKVNEIRIDNYLKAPLGEIMQVKQIGHKDNPNYIYCTYENGFGVNGFEPIPLTEEWLLKFGFEKHRFSHLKKHKSGVVLCLLDDSYTHLRAHKTGRHLVYRLLLERQNSHKIIEREISLPPLRRQRPYKHTPL